MELLKRFSLRPTVAVFAFLPSVRRPWGHRLPFKLKHISIVVYAYDLPVQQVLPHGGHTLDIECESVLSIGV